MTQKENMPPKYKFLFSRDLVARREWCLRVVYTLGDAEHCHTGTVFDSSATHVIVGSLKNSTTLFCALAAGKWIIHVKFLEDSEAKGHWLNPGDYEVGRLRDRELDPENPKYFVNAPQRCREEVVVRMKPLFASWNVGVLVHDCKDRRSVRWILKAGGADVKVINFPVKKEEKPPRVNWIFTECPNSKLLEEVQEWGIPLIPLSYLVDFLLKGHIIPNRLTYPVKDCIHENSSFLTRKGRQVFKSTIFDPECLTKPSVVEDGAKVHDVSEQRVALPKLREELQKLESDGNSPFLNQSSNCSVSSLCLRNLVVSPHRKSNGREMLIDRPLAHRTLSDNVVVKNTSLLSSNSVCSSENADKKCCAGVINDKSKSNLCQDFNLTVESNASVRETSLLSYDDLYPEENVDKEPCVQHSVNEQDIDLHNGCSAFGIDQLEDCSSKEVVNLIPEQELRSVTKDQETPVLSQPSYSIQESTELGHDSPVVHSEELLSSPQLSSTAMQQSNRITSLFHPCSSSSTSFRKQNGKHASSATSDLVTDLCSDHKFIEISSSDDDITVFDHSDHATLTPTAPRTYPSTPVNLHNPAHRPSHHQPASPPVAADDIIIEDTNLCTSILPRTSEVVQKTGLNQEELQQSFQKEMVTSSVDMKSSTLHRRKTSKQSIHPSIESNKFEEDELPNSTSLIEIDDDYDGDPSSNFLLSSDSSAVSIASIHSEHCDEGVDSTTPMKTDDLGSLHGSNAPSALKVLNIPSKTDNLSPSCRSNALPELEVVDTVPSQTDGFSPFAASSTQSEKNVQNIPSKNYDLSPFNASNTPSELETENNYMKGKDLSSCQDNDTTSVLEVENNRGSLGRATDVNINLSPGIGSDKSGMSPSPLKCRNDGPCPDNKRINGFNSHNCCRSELPVPTNLCNLNINSPENVNPCGLIQCDVEVNMNLDKVRNSGNSEPICSTSGCRNTSPLLATDFINRREKRRARSHSSEYKGEPCSKGKKLRSSTDFSEVKLRLNSTKGKSRTCKHCVEKRARSVLTHFGDTRVNERVQGSSGCNCTSSIDSALPNKKKENRVSQSSCLVVPVIEATTPSSKKTAVCAVDLQKLAHGYLTKFHGSPQLRMAASSQLPCTNSSTSCKDYRGEGKGLTKSLGVEDDEKMHDVSKRRLTIPKIRKKSRKLGSDENSPVLHQNSNGSVSRLCVNKCVASLGRKSNGCVEIKDRPLTRLTISNKVIVKDISSLPFSSVCSSRNANKKCCTGGVNSKSEINLCENLSLTIESNVSLKDTSLRSSVCVCSEGNVGQKSCVRNSVNKPDIDLHNSSSSTLDIDLHNSSSSTLDIDLHNSSSVLGSDQLEDCSSKKVVNSVPKQDLKSLIKEQESSLPSQPLRSIQECAKLGDDSPCVNSEQLLSSPRLLITTDISPHFGDKQVHAESRPICVQLPPNRRRCHERESQTLERVCEKYSRMRQSNRITSYFHPRSSSSTSFRRQNGKRLSVDVIDLITDDEFIEISSSSDDDVIIVDPSDHATFAPTAPRSNFCPSTPSFLAPPYLCYPSGHPLHHLPTSSPQIAVDEDDNDVVIVEGASLSANNIPHSCEVVNKTSLNQTEQQQRFLEKTVTSSVDTESSTLHKGKVSKGSVHPLVEIHEIDEDELLNSTSFIEIDHDSSDSLLPSADNSVLAVASSHSEHSNDDVDSTTPMKTDDLGSLNGINAPSALKVVNIPSSTVNSSPSHRSIAVPELGIVDFFPSQTDGFSPFARSSTQSQLNVENIPSKNYDPSPFSARNAPSALKVVDIPSKTVNLSPSHRSNALPELEVVDMVTSQTDGFSPFAASSTQSELNVENIPSKNYDPSPFSARNAPSALKVVDIPSRTVNLSPSHRSNALPELEVVDMVTSQTDGFSPFAASSTKSKLNVENIPSKNYDPSPFSARNAPSALKVVDIPSRTVNLSPSHRSNALPELEVVDMVTSQTDGFSPFAASSTQSELNVENIPSKHYDLSPFSASNTPSELETENNYVKGEDLSSCQEIDTTSALEVENNHGSLGYDTDPNMNLSPVRGSVKTGMSRSPLKCRNDGPCPDNKEINGFDSDISCRPDPTANLCNLYLNSSENVNPCVSVQCDVEGNVNLDKVMNGGNGELIQSTSGCRNTSPLPTTGFINRREKRRARSYSSEYKRESCSKDKKLRSSTDISEMKSRLNSRKGKSRTRKNCVEKGVRSVLEYFGDTSVNDRVQDKSISSVSNCTSSTDLASPDRVQDKSISSVSNSISTTDLASPNKKEENRVSQSLCVVVPAVEASTSSSEGTAISAKDFRKIVHGYLTKFHSRPWLRMGASPRPPCTNSSTSCEDYHGEGKIGATELSHHFNHMMIELIKDGFPLEAFQYCQCHITRTLYPGVKVVRSLVHLVLNTDNVDVLVSAQLLLRTLLELHPPCAYKMGAYYKQILLDSSTENGKEKSRGIFDDVISKLEEELNRTGEVNSPRQSVSTMVDTEDGIKWTFMHPEVEPVQHSYNDLSVSDRLRRLFIVFTFIVDVLERDLVVWLVKHGSRPRTHSVSTEGGTFSDKPSVLIKEETRPLIVSAIWTNAYSPIGSVSVICDRLIKLYLKGFSSHQAQVSFKTFHKIFALIIEAMNAAEPCSPNKEILEYGRNCENMAKKFLERIASADLYENDLIYMLKSLKPPWLPFYLCDRLVRNKLYMKNSASLATMRRYVQDAYNILQQACRSQDLQNDNVLHEPKGKELLRHLKSFSVWNIFPSTKEQCKEQPMKQLNTLSSTHIPSLCVDP